MEEYNSVKRKLEGFNSQSQEERDLNVNLNDIFDIKSRLKISTKLSGYFSKVPEHNSYNLINSLSFEIDRSLKNISMFEKRITHNAEKKIKSVQGSNSKSKELIENIKITEDRIIKLEEQQNELEEREIYLKVILILLNKYIKKNYNERLTNVDLKPKSDSIREAILKLKVK